MHCTKIVFCFVNKVQCALGLFGEIGLIWGGGCFTMGLFKDKSYDYKNWGVDMCYNYKFKTTG
ncbi:hypothetical protein [Moraxella lacunata]|uniref:hypothetical protein n=1 Tax=Moraxella lacunata TaxID=477 RepID=UPI003EE2F43F